jgi:hypothetical protein
VADGLSSAAEEDGMGSAKRSKPTTIVRIAAVPMD